MLGTVSPANIHLEETLATLRYACQVRAIVNRVRINEDPHEKLIRELKAEVLRLRGVREGYEKQLGISPRCLLDSIDTISQSNDEIKQKQQEIDKLKDQLKRTEEQLATSQMTWETKLRDTEEKKNSELKYLRRCGIAIEIDFHKDKQPCLVNLAADPMLSGTLLYIIPPGLVRIGKNSGCRNSSERLDIILDGPLVRPLHCTIENNNGKLILSSEMEGDTYVNGQVVTGKLILKHGDRLVIGGNHYFKVSNPHDEHSNVQISTQAVDYEFAYQEILKVQEEKLRAELEESKQKAVKELENAKREVEMQLGTQKLSYERKIEILSSTVEEQKVALEQICQKKMELEVEKVLLASEVETNNRLKQIQLDQRKMNAVAPYKSNFLQELENILNEQTADAEFALKMKASKDAISDGGISLHEMQLLVKEATERCREVGINYEFDQQQVVVNKTLRPVIRIRNKDSMKETLWQPMRFLDWVHRLRDYDIEDSMKELCTADETWEPYENTETFDDSLNSSRISINITPVKKHLNESLQQLSLDTSVFGSTFNQTLDISKDQETINACLIQIELATKTLCKLCGRNSEMQSLAESFNSMQTIVNNLRDILEVKDLSKCTNENVTSTLNHSSIVIENSDSTLPGNYNIKFASPSKPTLRNNGKSFDKKNVRFTGKLRNELT
ncbi:Kinesin-like protein KIF14 [Anthophora quadrimaculata]